MTLLNADQILNADDIQHQDVEVPEWGGTVRVQMLTGIDRDAWETEQVADMVAERVSGKKQKMDAKFYKAIQQNLKARLCVRCMVNESGERLFKDDQAESLGNKSAAALDRVYTVASRLNRVTDQDLDDMVKNSEPDQDAN